MLTLAQTVGGTVHVVYISYYSSCGDTVPWLKIQRCDFFTRLCATPPPLLHMWSLFRSHLQSWVSYMVDFTVGLTVRGVKHGGFYGRAEISGVPTARCCGA